MIFKLISGSVAIFHPRVYFHQHFAFGGYPGFVGQAKKFPPEQLDNVCPICEKKSLIPTDSPRGKLLIKELDFKVDEE